MKLELDETIFIFYFFLRTGLRIFFKISLIKKNDKYEKFIGLGIFFKISIEKMTKYENTMSLRILFAVGLKK